MRWPILLLAATGLLAAACQQPGAPLSIPDTTAVDTAGWETIDLVPNASAQAIAINDDGMVLIAADRRYFVYENGERRLIPTDGGAHPQIMTSTGRIAGQSGDQVVVVWDSISALPRQFEAGPFGSLGGILVVGMNDRDDLVAVQNAHDGIDGHARTLLWRNGVRQELGYFADSGIGYPSTYATALNASGQIVGGSKVALVRHPDSPPTEVFHPFMWENGVLRDLGVLAHVPCADGATPMDCGGGTANDINAHGVVVGWSTGPDNVSRAFVWENGVMRDLGVDPGQPTRASAINDRGQILGTSRGIPFLWEDGVTQSITSSVPAYPTALGANGEVIGSLDLGVNNLQHAFVWKSGQLIDLGVGIPHAINRHGDIIGTWYRDDGGYRAILWRKKRIESAAR